MLAGMSRTLTGTRVDIGWSVLHCKPIAASGALLIVLAAVVLCLCIACICGQLVAHLAGATACNGYAQRGRAQKRPKTANMSLLDKCCGSC